MSLPIRETPILRGAAARQFREQRERDETQAIPERDYRRAQAVYERMRDSIPGQKTERNIDE